MTMASAAAVVDDDDEAGKSGVPDVVVVVAAFAVNRLAVDSGDIDRHLRRHFYRNRKDDVDRNN